MKPINYCIFNFQFLISQLELLKHNKAVVTKSEQEDYEKHKCALGVLCNQLAINFPIVIGLGIELEISRLRETRKTLESMPLTKQVGRSSEMVKDVVAKVGSVLATSRLTFSMSSLLSTSFPIDSGVFFIVGPELGGRIAANYLDKKNAQKAKLILSYVKPVRDTFWLISGGLCGAISGGVSGLIWGVVPGLIKMGGVGTLVIK